MTQSGTADDRVAQLMRALDPDNIKVDGRDSRDRLAFAARFAELIMFYNQKNELAGNWKPFFVKDPLILLAVISKTDYTSYHRQFTQLQQQINQLGARVVNPQLNSNPDPGKNSNNNLRNSPNNPDQASQQQARPLAEPANAASVVPCALSINQLFILLRQMFCTINDWLHFMQMDARQYYLREFVVKKINDNIGGQLWKMVALQQFFTRATQGAIAPPDTNTYQQFESIWQKQKISQANYVVHSYTDDPSDSDASDDGSGTVDKNASGQSAQPSIENLMAQLETIYHQVFSFFVQVIDNARQSFYKMEGQPCDYPDTALLIAFSQLMENQQQQLNQFSGKHLDFYYQDILQQTLQSAQPDQVTVCMQLADNVNSLGLPAGTEFSAGSYPDKTDITFISLADVEINRAVIASAYTLFYLPSPATNATVSSPSEKNPRPQTPGLYRANIPAVNQVTRNQQQEILSWDGFGNTNTLPIQQGFALASPMLYLQSGERSITLVFEFNQALPENYLVDSQFYLSSEKGWFLVAAQMGGSANTGVADGEVVNGETGNGSTADSQTARSSATDTSNGTANQNNSSLTCQLTVAEAGPAIVPFVVNPDGYSSQWPLLKVILGPSVDLQNPPVLLSVSIQTEVNNFNQFTLANDISALPATGPALIFGPVPAVGSCFYVGSNEIFSKPLTAFAVTQAWDALPQDFSSYYLQYNQFLDPDNNPPTAIFSNSAFIGEWTLLSQKSWQSLPVLTLDQPPAQASVSLFQPQPASAATTTTTTTTTTTATVAPNNSSSTFTFALDSIAPYIPDATLMLAPLPLPGQAHNGYVCCELTLPSYAFGHSLYPKVVANVSLQNAQLLLKQANDNLAVALAAALKKIAAAATTLLTSIKAGVTGIINDLIAAAKKMLKSASDKVAAETSEDKTKKAAPDDKPVIQAMPDLPYSPKQSGLSASYSAFALTAFANSPQLAANSATNPVVYPCQFFHYGSFKPYQVFDALMIDEQLGQANLIPAPLTTSAEIKLFTGVSGQGCLYLALKNLLAPCTLSLFVELSQEDNPDQLAANSVGYYYWTATGWQPLTLLQNDTNNLTCSGIIVFDIPALSATQTSTGGLTYVSAPVMSGTDFWIAIATQDTASQNPAQNSALNIKFSYINTQAVKLSRAALTSLPAGETPVINAGSITTTKEKMLKVAGVTQPFVSVGGAAAENQSSYYWRVSNRLNHKDRVSSRVNYDNMAHAACSNLFYAKTLLASSASASGKKNSAAIRIGLVNGYANAQLPDAFRPVVNACDKLAIANYIAARVSAMAQVSVFNLNQQVVTIKATLSVQSLANANTLIQQINQQLKIYLSPWISSDLPQVNLQQGISRAALISLLTSYEGVEGLTSLSICLSPMANQAPVNNQALVKSQAPVNNQASANNQARQNNNQLQKNNLAPANVPVSNVPVSNVNASNSPAVTRVAPEDCAAVEVYGDIVTPADDEVIFVSAMQHQIQMVSQGSAQTSRKPSQSPRKSVEVTSES